MYEGEDRDDPVAVVEKEVRIKKPFTFKFSDLKPDTRYTAMVNGICKYNVIHRTARFLTKSEKITNFRIMIVSCDRPGSNTVKVSVNSIKTLRDPEKGRLCVIGHKLQYKYEGLIF